MAATRLVLEALRWSTGVWLLWHIPRCRPPAGPARAANASVIIPARNEATTLPRLLASLAAQEHPPAEVLVVDDDSTDDTSAVGRTAGAVVVTPGPLPPGWTGKTWACHHGAHAATSPTLVFLDADTELEPGGLERLLAEHDRRGGLVSVAPDHVTVRPFERLSAFFNVISMMGVDAFNPLRNRRPPRGAFGPCLVTSTADYQAAGGHEAVKAEVVEDLALSRRYVALGLPVTCLGGRGTIRFRMYPGGLGQLVEGWTKNFAGGAAATRSATFAMVFLWMAGCISATAYLVDALAGGGPFSPTAAAVLYAAYAGQLAWMLGRIGRFGWATGAVYPVPLAFFLGVFTRSLVRTHLRKKVTWRGRSIPTRPA